MPKKFKVATFNANSIRARLPIVLNWLKKEKPDVLALQETKVVDADFPKEPFEKEGWNVVFRGQKSYNGVAFISKNQLKNTVFFLNKKNSEEEARFISTEWENVLLINTYVPQGYMPDSPKFQKKLTFFKDLKKLFPKIVKKGKKALWMGDLNIAPTEIDLWDPKRNKEHVCFHPLARKAYEEITKGMWIDLFREKIKEPGHYTFWDYLWPKNFELNRGWRIDHILGTASIQPCLKKIWVDKNPRQQERPSDHTFLVAEFQITN